MEPCSDKAHVQSKALFKFPAFLHRLHRYESDGGGCATAAGEGQKTGMWRLNMAEELGLICALNMTW